MVTQRYGTRFVKLIHHLNITFSVLFHKLYIFALKNMSSL